MATGSPCSLARRVASRNAVEIVAALIGAEGDVALRAGRRLRLQRGRLGQRLRAGFSGAANGCCTSGFSGANAVGAGAGRRGAAIDFSARALAAASARGLAAAFGFLRLLRRLRRNARRRPRDRRGDLHRLRAQRAAPARTPIAAPQDQQAQRLHRTGSAREPLRRRARGSRAIAPDGFADRDEIGARARKRLDLVDVRRIADAGNLKNLRPPGDALEDGVETAGRRPFGSPNMT